MALGSLVANDQKQIISYHHSKRRLVYFVHIHPNTLKNTDEIDCQSSYTAEGTYRDSLVDVNAEACNIYQNAA